MAGNVVRVATQVTGTAKASSDLDKLRDKFERLQKQGAKGFALAAATLALVKVENGQFTGLKRLGIALKEGATATEALAAVQAVASGQAETYTQTIEGKLTVAQVKFNEALEKFGQAIAPPAAAAMGFLGDAATVAGDAFAAATDKTRGLTEAIDEQQHAAGAQGSILDVLAENWGKAGREADQYAAELDAMAENADKTDRAHRGLAAAAGTADTKFRRLRTDAERLGKSLKDVKDDAVSAASGLAELVFGPAELKARAEGLAMDIGDTVGELQKLEKIKHPTRAQQRDILALREKLAGLKGDLLETMTKLAALGDQPAKDYLTQWLDKLAAKLKFVMATRAGSTTTSASWPGSRAARS